METTRNTKIEMRKVGKPRRDSRSDISTLRLLRIASFAEITERCQNLSENRVGRWRAKSHTVRHAHGPPIRGRVSLHHKCPSPPSTSFSQGGRRQPPTAAAGSCKLGRGRSAAPGACLHQPPHMVLATPSLIPPAYHTSLPGGRSSRSEKLGPSGRGVKANKGGG